jgi:hypothetical protein
MINNQLESEVKSFLEGQSDFANLPSSEITRLSQVIRKKKIRQGQWIFDQEDEFEYVFLMKEGHVKLFSMNLEGDMTSVSYIVPQMVLSCKAENIAIMQLQCVPQKFTFYPSKRCVKLLFIITLLRWHL